MEKYTAKNGDFSYWDKEPRIYLSHIDKNGSHHYVDTRCPKCGGKGYLDCYTHVNGGICFNCGGTGVKEHKLVVYTEEYHKALVERRFKRACKEAEERNKAFFEKEGFTPDGLTWVVLGNTWEIKDQLKVAGAFYNRSIGWHFNRPVTEWPVQQISIDTVVGNYDDNGEDIHLIERDAHGAFRWWIFEEERCVKDYIKGLNDKYFATIAPPTEWAGEVGDKVTVSECFCKELTHFDTQWGTTFLYEFIDTLGHIFTWKTGVYVEGGKTVTVTGKIKALNEYKGKKQTELTRCKVAYV